MSLKLPDKKRQIKTTVDIDAELYEKAYKKMKKNNHTFKMIVDAALKEYLKEN